MAAPDRDVLLTVSHELRAPLASIRLAARALASGEVPEAERERLVRMIAREADHLDRLLGDLRAASVATVELAACDPEPILDEIAEAAALRAPAGSTVRVGVERGVSPVLADADRLRQVLVNLVDNALVHSPEHGTVVLSAGPGPGVVRFAVSDEGPGVPEEERERIFERLYGRAECGTGLGLWLARELVSRMDGRIWVEPREPAPGARFVFELPAA